MTRQASDTKQKKKFIGPPKLTDSCSLKEAKTFLTKYDLLDTLQLPSVEIVKRAISVGM